MTDYTIQTNFGAKDSLPSGNAAKTIRGSEFTTEFTNIATAIGTKVNRAGDTFSGAVTFSSTVTFNDAVDVNTTKVKLDGSDGELALGTNTFYTFDGNSANSVLSINQENGGGNMPAVYIDGIANTSFNHSSILMAAMGGTNEFELSVGNNQFKLGADRGIKCITTDTNPHLSPAKDTQAGPFGSNDESMDLGQSSNRWRYIYLRYSPVVTSDQKAKENITNADEAGSVLDNVKVRQFDWIDSGIHQSYGVIAQELLNVVPEAVKVPEDEDGRMGVSYETFIPMLIKEIQSLRSRVAELEGE